MTVRSGLFSTLPVVAIFLISGCTSDPSPAPDPASDRTDLRASLASVMAGNRVLPYSATWEVVAEGARLDATSIRLFYTRRAVATSARASGADQGESDHWNREHVWPQSYGIGDNAARTDVHNLVPVDATVNSARGNKPFDEAIVVHPECTVCRVSPEAWEPSPEVQGDVARIAFYMDVRYEGEDGVPDLVLTDDLDPARARFGHLSTLARWHCDDPVSEEEIRRHEVAANAQGNRNVFVDSPHLAESLFGFSCVRPDGIDR